MPGLRHRRAHSYREALEEEIKAKEMRAMAKEEERRLEEGTGEEPYKATTSGPGYMERRLMLVSGNKGRDIWIVNMGVLLGTNNKTYFISHKDSMMGLVMSFYLEDFIPFNREEEASEEIRISPL